MESGRCVLERTSEGALPLARQQETLCLYGLPAPREVRGARQHRFAEGHLTVDVEGDWRRLEILL